MWTKVSLDTRQEFMKQWLFEEFTHGDTFGDWVWRGQRPNVLDSPKHMGSEFG